MPQRDPQTFAIIGACMAVQSELGHGFLEPVYQEALAIELAAREIPFEPQKLLAITYRGETLEARYRPDFICYGAVIVELKALAGLESVHEAQVINYLKATGIDRGLLINFGAAELQYKRLIFTPGYRRTHSQNE